MKVGRPEDIVRTAWAERFQIQTPDRSTVWRMLSNDVMRQLSECKDDCARRLILGCSEVSE